MSSITSSERRTAIPLALAGWLRRLEHWLPRRLTTRVTLAVVLIVVAAGLITAGAINQVLVRHLRVESITSGQALTLALGESLANPLVEGDLAAVQEAVNGAVRSNQGVVYAFAFGPSTPIIHTFPEGFPADLLQTIPATGEAPGEGILLRTEQGLVRDFGYRPLDGLPAEVHLGISQRRIGAVQHQVTGFVMALTAVGCLLAAVVGYGFSRLATYPLAALTRRVQRLGQGSLDERIDLPPGDEVGDLAEAFNQMAADLQASIQQLQASEAGYRGLIAAAGSVGEGIALICDEGPNEGKFLFVNEAFARLAGYRAEELLDVNAAGVLHPDTLTATRRAWEAIRAGNGQQPPRELTLVDRHGRPHILETAGTLVDYQGRRALAWFTRDISDRKAREEELRRRNRELAALNAVTSAMSGPLETEMAVSRALDAVLSALELEVGWVFITRSEGDFQLAASQGVPSDMLLEKAATAFPDCPCGDVFRLRAPRVVSDLLDSCLARGAAAATGKPLRCHATVPLLALGQVLGVLSVAAEKSRFHDEELALLAAVGRQMGVALENARLWEALRERERVRGELLARAIQAQEEERQRIARELHDETGSSLNALVFGLKTVEKVLERAPAQASALLDQLKESASHTVQELQAIIYDLRPSLLDDLGLIPALRWYADERLGQHGVAVDVQVGGQERRLPPEVETALFRIGQEALSNIVRHAAADEVRLEVTFAAHEVKIEVVDNGCGFDIAAALAGDDRRALGILGMQERAVLLGGRLDIASVPGQGTRVSVAVPMDQWKEDS